MAHFAKLDSNNLVTQVIVVGNSDITDINGDEVESIGVAFCQKLLGPNILSLRAVIKVHLFQDNSLGDTHLQIVVVAP